MRKRVRACVIILFIYSAFYIQKNGKEY